MATPKQSNERSLRDFFNEIAKGSANWMGSPSAFVSSVLIVLVWALSGPFFHYSDTWQLVINTGTTVLTFLAVFLIQNTQNRDAKAIQLKLDELIRAIEGARNHFVDLQALPDEELEKIAAESSNFREKVERSLKRNEAGVSPGPKTAP